MGKQHGGLARAGKVKKQTPKVEKMDNIRPVTGRAKKRLLYQKRFVSAIEGSRRGPNSQSKA